MRNIDVRAASLDELALAYAEVGLTVKGYEELGLEVPEALVGQLRDIKREATERVRVELEKKLKRAQLRRESMATADEKRAKLDAEIAALKTQLA